VHARSDSHQLSKRTDAYPYTNDQAVNIGVARWWYYGQTAEQVTILINSNEARLTQIRVDNPSVPTFTVTMVRNTGAYGSAWWWYFGVDGPTLGGLLAGKRLISLDPYQTSAGIRFAAVMVPNTGVRGRAWWWYYGIDAATVGTHLNTNKARLVSLRPYLSGDRVVYAVIMVANADIDTKGWYWLLGQSISDIANVVNANQQRVVSLARNPLGGWDAILVGSEGERWWWWYGVDGATVTNKLIAHSTRLIDVTPYTEGGVRKFAVVELDDSNPEQPPINPESSRVHAFAESNGWKGGFHGAYIVNSTSPIVAYNSRFRFEPASAIKSLYLLYTLKQGVPLTDPITYYWPDPITPNPNVCPLDVPLTPQTTTIGTALIGMIQSSNNVYTRAFAVKWGTAAVQAFAHSIGMGSTFVGQAFIGCGFRGAVRNEISLSDLVTLYRAVDEGTALTGTARHTFLNTLVGGPGAGGSTFSKVITEEASSLGKSSIASSFFSALDVRWKAGGYGFGLAPAGTGKIDFSIGGLAYVPVKTASGATQLRSYYFGDFVNDLVTHCPTTGPCPDSDKAGALLLGAVAEAMRGPIRDALTTWPSAVVSDAVDEAHPCMDSGLQFGEDLRLFQQEKWVK
jgi:hypothetical protein